ncbi:hypothetical protein [Spirillospora sp. CA-294931]|uniref:hypothetical protein n=1 Tax=Spirillospora sp. CA-294931 TaxID=3240042 RepID=UPI003D8DD920
MPVNATPNSSDPLEALREEFPGHRVWRSMRGDIPGEWCATLHDPNAGVDPTLMEPTANDLRERLLAEGERAKGRARVLAD